MTDEQTALFQYKDGKVRTLKINDEIWFVANDVTEILGYKNGRDAVARHCKSKGVAKHDTPTTGGKQSLTHINESNLYRLVISSELPSSEEFEE